MADIFCPICKSEAKILHKNGKDYFIGRGKSADFDINYCAVCQTAFSSPFLTDKELTFFYPENYEAYAGKKGFLGWLQVLKYKADLRLIKKTIKKSGASIFEIGAGRGEFLDQARYFGFKIAGLEPGRAGRDFAQKNYNIILQPGLADGLIFGQKYDLMVARHVFEHLNDPKQILAGIKEGLADNGILFLKLPRFDSWEARFFKKYWSGYDLPRHRFHYSSEGILKLLQNCGFDQIKIISEQVPSDIIRSLEYYCLGEKDFWSGLFNLFLFLPSPIKLILAQLAALVFSPFGSGRMIIVAKNRK